MKICFVTSRPFGLQGTPGTYLFIEYANQRMQTLTVAPNSDQNIVYTKKVPLAPVNGIEPSELTSALKAIAEFNPDIIYIFNSPQWPECAAFLKPRFPKSKFLLDVKTPLLKEGDERTDIQTRGQRALKHIDIIATLSHKSVKTWLPTCEKPIFEYPLGIDISLFPDQDSFQGKRTFTRFIYIGSLHKKRKVSKLVECFAHAAKKSPHSLSLDIFGRGLAGIKQIEEMLPSLPLNAEVNLRGVLPQDQLLKRLPNYDAGIAWVPHDIFSDSPSLKALEYMAAGIPILASRTVAHEQLAHNGCSISYFDNTPKSFVSALSQLSRTDISREALLENRRQMEQFDYRKILSNDFTPVFEGLMKDEPSPSEKTTVVDDKHPPLTLVLLMYSLAAGKGGAERVAIETANNMANRGHIVYMAFHDKGAPAYALGKNVVPLPFKSYEELEQAIHNIDPDVFFSFYFNRDLLIYHKLVYRTGIPFGMQECTNPDRLVHNNWLDRRSKRELSIPQRVLEREAVASSAHCIRLTMPQYKESFPSYIQPCVRAFSNPAFPQDKLANPGKTEGELVITNIGGMKQNKNLMALLQAFEPLSAEFPNWVIKVYGKTAEGRQPHKVKIVDFIKKHKLKNKVLIYGPTDDIFKELAASQIHVIASLSEGCPTCVLEAMATGLPSIGFSDCSGTNQFIKHKANGLLAEPGDSADPDARVRNLREALRQLMESPELRVSQGQQALENSKSFAPKAIYDQWEKLFYEAAAYKSTPDRLFKEQIALAPELPLSSQRTLEKLMSTIPYPSMRR